MTTLATHAIEPWDFIALGTIVLIFVLVGLGTRATLNKLFPRHDDD